MSDTQRTAEAEIEHFSGSILKRNADGVEVLSSTLEPGEELISGNAQSEVEEAGQAVEKADETQSIRESDNEPTNDAGETKEQVDATKDEVAKNDPAEDKTETPDTVVDPAADDKTEAKTTSRARK